MTKLRPASIPKTTLRAASIGLAFASLLGLFAMATQPAQAQTKETVLYTFTGSPDGASPWAGLIRDKAGNFYGTTHDGGGLGQGTVFELTANGKETVLYSFRAYPDAAHPEAVLIRDAAGDLFGTTTYYGGAYLWGAVFKVTKTSKETVLYSFTGGTDGGYPTGGVTRDAAGNLYGTTVDGAKVPNATTAAEQCSSWTLQARKACCTALLPERTGHLPPQDWFGIQRAMFTARPTTAAMPPATRVKIPAAVRCSR
jgi:uncharacterized repeat protein (TIGR03803 family)